MNKSYQLATLYIVPLLAVLAALAMKANYPWSIVLFWGIPSLLLTLWAKDKAPKAAFFALAGTVLLTTIDIIFWANRQWVVVSAFHSKFLNLVAWEDLPFWFLFVYFPVIFWEHFSEKKRTEPVWSRRMSEYTILFILVFLITAVAWMWFPQGISIPYFYLIVSVVFVVIPLSLELKDHPLRGLRFLKVGAYFAYVAILYELTALHLELWYYPSEQFIGWMNIGGLRFPVEEFFAWILFGVAAILAVYDYLDDYAHS